ncbi:hypothetical protein, partial [Burkholderia vietnamiensis]
NLLLFSVPLRTGRSLKADRYMNLFINLTYFSVRLLILSLSDPKISSLPSSAHTYRLLIFKERRVSNVSFVSRLNQERPNYGFPQHRRQALFENFLTSGAAGSVEQPSAAVKSGQRRRP